MKTEIEARLLECDVDLMISRLEILGATFKGDWLQLRYCYDFNPVDPNRWIRLRTNGVSTTLTIKDISNNSISGTKESEIVVSSFDTTDEMLNQMGYYARTKQENRRIQYVLDGVEVDIDMWPLIPPYMEFEGDSEEAIYDVCDKLGIDRGRLISDGVSAIYSKYGYGILGYKDLVLEEDKKKKEIKR